MEPTGHPVVSPTQVGVALSPTGAAPPMIGASDRCEARCSQRRDRHRHSVVGIVLVRTPSTQDPHSRRQRRRGIEHPLAGTDELLSEQVPEAAADSIAHVRSSNPDAHRNNWSTWWRVDRTFTFASCISSRSTPTAVCEPLCGSTPMMTCMCSSAIAFGETKAGTPDYGSSCVSHLFRATPRRNPRGPAPR